MSETCKHPDTSFDRTLCPAPCNMMHNYCTECGECVDPCPHKATPSSGVTEGKAESGERIPGRDYCPLDGEPLWLRIQSGGKPQLYIHADRLTWHTDVTDKIRTAAWEYPFTAEAPGSPEAMLREIFAAQPPAPADEGFGEEYWRGHSVGRCEERERLEPSEDDNAALTDLIRNGLLGDDGLGAQHQRTDDGLPRDLARWIIDAGWRKPGADDAATVLAGLLAGFEHERWWSADDEVKFKIWTKAMKRVEAAQQRLADRGQSGGQG